MGHIRISITLDWIVPGKEGWQIPLFFLQCLECLLCRAFENNLPADLYYVSLEENFFFI